RYMDSNLRPIPQFSSEDEEREFWTTHDSTEYIDWSKAERNPPYPQFSAEDQNEIRNASDRVVVVAARIALDEYLKYSTYICQPDRAFRDCVRMAFYTQNKIDRHIPKILGQIEAISRDEIERRTDLLDSDRARLRTLRDTMEPARREDWSKRQYKIVFLTPP